MDLKAKAEITIEAQDTLPHQELFWILRDGLLMGEAFHMEVAEAFKRGLEAEQICVPGDSVAD